MLPLTMILLLLVAAVVILFLKNNKAAKALALVALGAAFVVSAIMAAKTSNGGSISLIFGGEPWNMSILVGALESYMACIFSCIGFLVMWASVSMIEHDVERDRIPFYYALVCALVALLSGVLFFENLINVFIFIELSAFAAAGIVIIRNEPENIRSGLKYLTLSILGSGLVLTGIVILYTVSGSLAFTAIGNGIGTAFAENRLSVLYALIFISVGIFLKSALFPFHIWLPDAHATAPSPSSAILSSLVLKAFIVFYIKILYIGIGQDALHDSILRPLMLVVLILGVCSMIYGSLMAILQTDIKRMIAYSSVSQIGYIFIGIGLGNRAGLFASLFYILAHAVTKSGLFLGAGSIIEQTHNRRIDQMDGLGVRMPVTMGLFSVGALSMVGIPLFIGFNSKWSLSLAILDAGDSWVLIPLVVSTLLNAIYYLPVVIRAFFGKEAQQLRDKKAAGENVSLERPLRQLLPIIILVSLVVLLAMFSAPISVFIETAISSIW